MQRRILLFILFGFSVGLSIAQQRQQSFSVSAKTISSTNTGTGKFYYANRNEPARALEFKERAVTTSTFLANINYYFNIPAEFTFIEVESNTDHIGMRHRLLQQYFKDIPLEGMVYRVHEKDGFVRSVNGKAVRNIKLNTQTILSDEQAFHLAAKYLQTKDTTVRQGKKLIVSKDFTFMPESFSLAFQFDIDVSLIEQWRISIDARTGDVINKVNLVNTCFKENAPPPSYGKGKGMTNYYGSQSIQVEKYEDGSSHLVGQTEHGGTIGTYNFGYNSIMAWIFNFYSVYDFTSSDSAFNEPYQKTAVSVQWAAEQAYEYYFKNHNRNSFDNNGSPVTSYTNVDQGWNNAAWSRNVLLFGDGINNKPLVELDVVSHELTHGVIQYEANLQYYAESGALNESFSDIMGKAVEFSVFGDTASWQFAKHWREGGLRDFSNPNLKNQPDTYAGDMWYAGYEDYGGVHYNSGVQNFWFYLLCEGGSGVNDHQVNYSVKSIGMDTAVNIAYRNLTEYLSYYSDYLDSRIGSLLATADLYGKNSFAYQEVDKAWDAVGVINEPIITSLELYDITATTVKIKGTLLPRGDTVTYHFEYGTTLAFGNVTSIYKYTNTVEGIVRGLQSQTKYYLRLVATNENGNTSGATSEFTTISLAPLVKIRDAIDVTETTATFRGQINPNSLPTSFYFEYGPTPALGLVTASYPIPDTTEFLNVSASVTNLKPRQTYYYRLIGTNGFASYTTESVNFFTAVKPVINSYTPIAASPGTEVTIIGQNFNSILEKNVVNFGATRGMILSSSSTEIKVKVPTGASLGPITLLDTESGLATESVLEFVPTFTGEYKKGSLQLRAAITEPYVWKSWVQDMDNDGKPDIVSIHYQGFSIFQNVNQGGDITAESFVRNTTNVPAFNSSGDFQVIDFDGNGLKDIVARSSNGLGLLIYPNFSVPGYIFFGIPVELNFNIYFGHLAFGDFDIDGHIDIAVATPVGSDSSIFSILRNQNPKGYLAGFNFEQQYSKVLHYYVEYLTSADLNNDGTPDLMIGADYKKYVSILKNNSHPGTFQFEETIVQDLVRGERYVRYFSQDLNQDGWKDIIAHSPHLNENMTIIENKGTTPDITMEMPAIALRDTTETAVQTADMNGDGKVDLIVALRNRQFIFLKNNVEAGMHFSDSSFKKFEAYGTPLNNSDRADTKMVINDLNGDGRPEIINSYYYYFGPHDVYQMEIWQNSPNNCLDPSLIKLNVSNYSASIVLPPNTALDQFEIEYAPSGANYWWRATSTTLSFLNPGYPYQLRARTKCYLGFSEYYYISFTAECVETNSFSISYIGVDRVFINAFNLSSIEVQYSLAGKNQWIVLPQNVSQISNLLPGTTYDLRYRGRCNTPTEFNYKQFSTQCPTLSSLTITDLIYNKAVVSWSSSYTGIAILEYSVDNVTWTLIDETRVMFPLIPGKQYLVRGRLACTDINSEFMYTSLTTPCPKVSLLDANDVTPLSANINWVDESDASSYTLTYSMVADGTVTTVETSSTSFNIDGLNPGTQYTVAVAPQCINTKDFTSTIFSTVCYVPFNLSANAITHTTAELSWSDNFSALPYSIDYSILGSNVWLTIETTLTTVSLAKLRPGTEYEVRVHINCLSETARYVSLLFETDLYGETTFAPNPTDSKITIYPSKNLIGNRFNIYDSSGKSVVNGELLEYTIDLSHFYSGVYILKIDGEKPMKIIR